ncbi:MAG: transcriptional regulator NrdR [Chlamydiae bacterium GWC2_50_10]|nr:MAG: transcriptional regulator NrdR [Chlamydiae bacterium GWA2_50_15]OGN53923.1 MAG: transcriptional regulator NrdR [Chlamydiae bacterium GWC2_50_10]OGN55159.1 MAG: transcriptional regulator NrdR [Chlamydiae bacterium GWF2_49_8]OGN64611.1 MAG: transcriptional regulator NrdR [Chlamydiae bacterium RIFCSPHIGHO2_12_FULL_49_32]OGN68021.1 MAG: transcriptional regulator NrdR [Chlamydiae bacterium RIFCSPLOWO2_02_FULL_49_12]OGN70589.1 MAG: transcriptional regulator NrdR [Chlamydiae bacterium RIFCSPL
MRCPYCFHEELKVTDSRETQELNGIKRRRECLSCQKRFTTYETIELTIQVEKRDGSFEEFQKEKLIKGLELACRHTRISHDQVLTLANQMATRIMEKGVPVIKTVEIGERVMEELRKLDTVAYIRFACVYRRFKDVDELVDAIETCSEKST